MGEGQCAIKMNDAASDRAGGGGWAGGGGGVQTHQ